MVTCGPVMEVKDCRKIVSSNRQNRTSHEKLADIWTQEKPTKYKPKRKTEKRKVLKKRSNSNLSNQFFEKQFAKIP